MLPSFVAGDEALQPSGRFAQHVFGLRQSDADMAPGGLAEAGTRHHADLFGVEQGPGESLAVGFDRR